LPAKQLTAHATSAPDPLTAWAATYMARTGDHSLQPMLEAAMQRHYSGAPASFFTGGGVQGFGNFERDEDIQNPTVGQAFAHSINLAFVRLLQDITSFYGTGTGRPQLALLTDRDNPQRDAYLRRFADQDGKRYLARFYKDYRGLDGNQALDLLAHRTRPVPRKLAAAYLSVHPDARLADLRNFLTQHLPHGSLDDDRLWDSYLGLSPLRMSLADRAYVAGVHPLELWLVNHLQDHPNASRQELVAASEQTRQEVYSWLFKGSAHKQDIRIRLLLEQDAFERILENWRRLGYPFAHLIPSLGTAIGASGDRPDALAELMGIILNDGVRQPTVDIERLHFATGTPYETNLVAGGKPQRVMSVEVARTLRQTLTEVVAQGTASRLRGAYVSASGEPTVIGGKTGTGDNRFDRFSRGGGIISSRVVDRTATFVFFLGDRFYGTVTAYVPGEQAAKYHFTSGLAVQLLKSLEPELRPLLDSPATPNSPPVPAATVIAFEPVHIPQSGSSAPPMHQHGASNRLTYGEP
jgi:membrane peptidoglycan carboxypeptidase